MQFACLRMGKIIEKVLQAYISELCDCLNCGPELLNRFLSQNPPIITRVEKGDILAQDTPYKKNDALVTLLVTKDDRALDVLYDYLKEIGHRDLADALKKFAEDAGHRFSSSPTNASTNTESVLTTTDIDFPIAKEKVPVLRKYLEQSTELLNNWLLIKDDFVITAGHRCAVETQYNLKVDNAKELAISSTLNKWLTLGKTVATFQKLIAIIEQYDQSMADQLLADRDKIQAVDIKTK